MKQNTLKAVLKGKIPKKQLDYVPSSFDVVGDIAILEMPKEIEKKEKLIAETLLNLHKNINVVCKKVSIHQGKYRTQRYRILAGEGRKETIHKENNVRMKLHIEKTYFSVRLSTERKRISLLVKPNEKILVMFGGVAPYALVLSKNTKAKEVVSVEINPAAHKYALENVQLNKSKNIILFKGDVRKILPKISQKFDRILMPLPKGAGSFLDIALSKIKKNGVIHFYDFISLDKIKSPKKKIGDACKLAKKRFKILNIAKCGQFSPGKYRVCVDFKIL